MAGLDEGDEGEFYDAALAYTDSMADERRCGECGATGSLCDCHLKWGVCPDCGQATDGTWCGCHLRPTYDDTHDYVL